MKTTITILMLAGVVLFGVLNPQNAIANPNSIVGSWIVDVTPVGEDVPPPFQNLGTFTQDGGNINSDPSFGGGHGLWKRVSHRKFAVIFKTIVPAGFENNPPFLSRGVNHYGFF